jgi:hypothetical protein
VSPLAAAVIVAEPELVGVNADVATPLEGVTGEAGENDPGTPATENVTRLVAVVTVLPVAS